MATSRSRRFGIAFLLLFLATSLGGSACIWRVHDGERGRDGGSDHRRGGGGERGQRERPDDDREHH